MKKRMLVMENGVTFTGKAFGSSTENAGEVVFNTSMTGYQEMMSDPSYCGQILTLTYPLIGNYGINRDDFESITPYIKGLIVKSASVHPSHFRSRFTLHEWLKANNIPGLMGIDTRKLTRMIREHGTMKGMFCETDADIEAVVAKLQETAFPNTQVAHVSTKTRYVTPASGKRIVLIDYGAKKGIIKDLNALGFEVIVVPFNTKAQDVMALSPDGVMLSNGPGDPQDIPEAVETVKDLLGQVPIFGICLGHQLLALASGASTEKMRFGHRGANHPVKDLRTGKVAITSQNHGYTVNPSSVSETNLEITHVNVNDQSVEGLSHTIHPAFSVQYHPEASPGPEDAKDLFLAFKHLVDTYKPVTKKEGIVHA
ncbi:glutamine-hydrolyzing carbamoyl-phosphate synthase small subunit [Bacillus sp. H-16]|uniref:carbamoyl phosphate synthase small subunit n=1 Tax=Alteribacter salitolerans TaxID=2912333 RepID=UPI0019644ADE|nr:carbamoyl phosphate synthase small subunit [Alteribacter salitolerans]MBM7095839.1 glutamine-hydrolyzing carbamoyl-phosphate synthase small subunit [Alteribacter salitolerans]